MKVRKASRDKMEGVALVLKESYNIESLDEGKEVFLSEEAKGVHYIIAEIDGKVAGLVTWYMHGLPKHGLVELDRIAVLPDLRGRGIAKQLFDALIEDAKKYYQKHNGKLRKLIILTHASNKRAHKFYEKMGLKHETTLKDHYYKGEDEWVYSMFFD